jgi:alkylhydroperoxidase/carboxymuconolactone decarboxylase family protein YurZ
MALTQAQASEVIRDLAYYARWPNAFSALRVQKRSREERQMTCLTLRTNG